MRARALAYLGDPLFSVISSARSTTLESGGNQSYSDSYTLKPLLCSPRIVSGELMPSLARDIHARIAANDLVRCEGCKGQLITISPSSASYYPVRSAASPLNASFITRHLISTIFVRTQERTNGRTSEHERNPTHFPALFNFN